MSERTLRRCITLYGILASTNMVNQVYSAYYKLMKTISAYGLGVQQRNAPGLSWSAIADLC